jgi:hypothetical protein
MFILLASETFRKNRKILSGTFFSVAAALGDVRLRREPHLSTHCLHGDAVAKRLGFPLLLKEGIAQYPEMW